jgi:hypothetical protein
VKSSNSISDTVMTSIAEVLVSVGSMSMVSTGPFGTKCWFDQLDALREAMEYSFLPPQVEDLEFSLINSVCDISCKGAGTQKNGLKTHLSKV